VKNSNSSEVLGLFLFYIDDIFVAILTNKNCI